MSVKMTIFRQGLLLVFVPLVFQLGFVLVVARMQRYQLEVQTGSLHSQEVLTQIAVVSRALGDATAGIRGLVLSGDADFAEPYIKASRELPGALEELQLLAAGNPEQHERARRIADQSLRYLAWQAETDRLVQSGDREQAAARVRSGTGEEQLDAIREEVRAFTTEETRVSEARDQALAHAQRRLQLALRAGVLASLGITVLLAVAFTRGISGRLATLTENTRRLARGEELASPIRGHDEITRLDRAFHEMAQAVQRSESALRGLNDDLEQRVHRRTAELEAANRELAQSQARLAEFIRAATAAIITMDHQGKVIEFNPAAEQMFGYERGAAVGKELAELIIPPAQRVWHREGLARCLRTGESDLFGKRLEMSALRADGSEFPVELTVTSVRVGGPPIFMGYAVDITERHRLEAQFRQAQKMEAVGRLAGGVAHDFNNLLTIIVGCSDLLLAGLADEDPARALVEEVKKAGERAGTLTRQMLAFSRKQVLVPCLLNLNGLVADVEKMLRRLIGEDIELTTELDPSLHPVLADRGQLEQVLLNLVVNARDAMPGGGRLIIQTGNVELDEAAVGNRPELRPGPYVMLAVNDTGCGMDREIQKHLFEPFFTTKEVGRGTGLGLAMVYGFVKQSGGFIYVYSEPGQGTTVKVYLPRAADSAATPESRAGPPAPPRGQETVLLVEDEEGVRALAGQVLQRQGYTVLVARHGYEALDLCQHYPRSIDLLVTDVIMPRMNGRQLADRLTSLHQEVKVLYLSGYTDPAIVQHGVLDPGTSFLQKPFTPSGLAHKVREVLDAPRALEPVGGRMD